MNAAPAFQGSRTSITRPILVTGAAGRLGAVGRTVVELLRQRKFPVRALVRLEDQRAEALPAIGAEVVSGDLTEPADVAASASGSSREPRADLAARLPAGLSLRRRHCQEQHRRAVDLHLLKNDYE